MPDQLPLLGGNNRLLVGTYVAEQRSKDCCHLLAASTKRQPLASARGEPRRRTRRFENAKSSVLPALIPIEPLLGSGARRTQDHELKDTSESLGLMVQNMSDSEDVFRRVYPGRGCNALAGDIASTAPRTAEYYGWLRLPRGLDGPPRHGALSARTESRHAFGSSPIPDRPSPLSARCSSLDAPTEENAPPWHVVLLQSTFKEKGNTPLHVTRVLEHALRLNSELAKKKVATAQKRLTVKVASMWSSGEAFEKVETLRGYGVNARVVSEMGFPGEQEKGQESATYGELFRKGLRGTSERAPRGPPRLFGPPAIRCSRSLHGTTKNELPQTGRMDTQFDAIGTLQKAVGKQIEANHMSSFRRNMIDDAPEASAVQSKVICKQPSLAAVAVLVTERAKGDAQVGAPRPEAPRASIYEPNGSPGVLTVARKEACQMLRFFVYGEVGNEFSKTLKEREAIFHESQGTQEQVVALFNMWSRLDEDGSGRVDIFEFRSFAEKHMRQRLEEFVEAREKADAEAEVGEVLPKPELAMLGGQFTPEEALKFTSRLCDRLGALLLGKKSSFVVEDMMRIIWPGATVNDVKEMWGMFKKFKQGDRNRIKTPPLLPAIELEALLAVFRYYDSDQSGELMLEELVEHGLIYEDQMAELFRAWDRNGDGSLDQFEFAEMMCPPGFRAHAKAKMASYTDGTRLIFDEKLDCWRIQGSDVVSSMAEAP